MKHQGRIGLELTHGRFRTWCFVVCTLVGGCHTCDRVESELRARECDVRELREELDRCHLHNQALQTELKMIRGEAPILDPSHPVPIYPVRSIVLGRQTGGHEGENGIGDDALQVVLEPHDAENQSVKVPGAVHIEVLEVTSAGLKKPLSSWDISPEELSKSWRIGLLGSGYKLILPWKVWPSTEKLRVMAQMQLSDGRVFEADRDVTIRLPADKRRAPMEKVEPEMPLLPTPRPVPPMPKASPTPNLPPEPLPVPTGPELPAPTKYEAPATLGKPRVQVMPARLERPTSTGTSEH